MRSFRGQAYSQKFLPCCTRRHVEWHDKTRDRIVVYTTNSSAGNGHMSTSTEQAYSELQHAYDVFNTRLFTGQLPPCLITMQRKNRTYGYVSGEQWNDHAGAVTD